MGSLIFYFIFFLVEAILGFAIGKMDRLVDSNSKNIKVIKFVKVIITFIFILIPAVIASRRYGIGTDYFAYEQSYFRMLSLSFSAISYNMTSLEIGFYFIAKLSQLFGNSYSTYLFFISLFTYSTVFFAMKRYSKKSGYGLMIFMYLLLFLAPSFNIMRQIMATSIIFLGYRYIEERKMVKYLLTVLVAMFFHTSAIFCLPLYFINFYSKKFSKTKEIIIIAVALILPLLFNYLFDYLGEISLFSKYTTLYRDQISYQNNIGTLLIRMPIFIPLLINWKRLIEYNRNNQFFLLLYVLEFTSILLGFYMHWAFRILYYCLFAEIVLIPQVIALKKGKNKMFYTLYFVLYYISYFIVVYYVWGNDQIFPYVSI